jgi:hypothetical protein
MPAAGQPSPGAERSVWTLSETAGMISEGGGWFMRALMVAAMIAAAVGSENGGMARAQAEPRAWLFPTFGGPPGQPPSCAVWLMRDRTGARATLEYYALGVVTGLNVTADRDRLSGLDSYVIWLMLDDACKTDPSMFLPQGLLRVWHRLAAVR